MPPKGKRYQNAARGSGAQARVGADVAANETLNSFLGGLAMPSSALEQEESVKAVEVSLRLATKSSDTTKLKALSDLTRRCDELTDESLATYVCPMIELIYHNVRSGNMQVRTGVFDLLHAIVRHGKPVKAALLTELSALSGPWVLGMFDMEFSVRRAALASFETAFSAERRAVMLSKFAEPVMQYLIDLIDEVLADKKPIKDDTLDLRGNAAYASLTGLGHMVKQVPGCHKRVLELLTSSKLLPFFPVRATAEGAKSSFVKGAPLVRSSLLVLLRDVVIVCPLTHKHHQLISSAVYGGVLDTDARVVQHCWELLLVWCKKFPSESINCFQPNFLDDVVDSFMQPISQDVAEIIFPSLLPFLGLLSKDGRLTEVVDEFCGALVEKVKKLNETPNVSAREMDGVFTALMECWGLHHFRKKGTEDAEDTEELFTVIMNVLHVILSAPQKRLRYSSTLIHTLAVNLLKASLRGEAILHRCVIILFQRDDAKFRMLSADATEEERATLNFIACSLLNEMIALSLHTEYVHAKRYLLKVTDDICATYIAAGEWNAAIMLMQGPPPGSPALRTPFPASSPVVDGTADSKSLPRNVSMESGSDAISSPAIASTSTPFEPREESQRLAVAELQRRLRIEAKEYEAIKSSRQQQLPPQHSDPSSPVSTYSRKSSLPSTPILSAAPPPAFVSSAQESTRSLLQAVLRWTKVPQLNRQVQQFLTDDVPVPWVQRILKELKMADPQQLLSLLRLSCQRNVFEDIRSCVARLSAASETSEAGGVAGAANTTSILSDEARAELLRDVASGLQSVRRAVEAVKKGSPADSESEERAARKGVSGTAPEGKGSKDRYGDETGDEEYDEENSNDDEGSGSGDESTGSDDDGSEDEEPQNAGIEACYQLVEWAELLQKGTDMATLLQLSADDISSYLLPLCMSVLSNISPQLFPEKYVSVKALRQILLQASQESDDDTSSDDDNGSGSSGDEENSGDDTRSVDESVKNTLHHAIQAKVHHVNMNSYKASLAVVHQLAASYGITEALLDTMSEKFFYENVFTSHAAAAAGQLSFIAPLASTSLLQRIARDRSLWKRYRILPDGDQSHALFNGCYSLSQLHANMTTGVRTAQLVRLVDSCNAVEAGDAVEMVHVLLTAAAVREVLSAPIATLLFDKLLPEALMRVSSAHDAERLAHALIADSDDDDDGVLPTLVCTLGCVLLHCVTTDACAGLNDGEEGESVNAPSSSSSEAPAAPSGFAVLGYTGGSQQLSAARVEHGGSGQANALQAKLPGGAFADVVRHLGSAVASCIVESFKSTASSVAGGSKPSPSTNGGKASDAVTMENYALYICFFNQLDGVAEVLHTDLLANLSQPDHQLLLEIMSMISSFPVHIAIVSLVVHRHLSMKPTLADSTAKQFMEYAQRQPPLLGLELLAEMTLTRIITPATYTDLIRVIMHYMHRCYALHHLPTNGRLSARPPNSTDTVSVADIRRVVVAAVTARRGVVAHNRLDDQLRATVNLIVFDVICECVLRLRQCAEEELPELARLIAFTTDFVKKLTPQDVAVLRASELSTQKMSSVLAFAFMWLSSTSIAKLEMLNMDTVALMIECVCSMSSVALMRSKQNTSVLLDAVFTKNSLRRVRTQFSTVERAKLRAFQRLNAILAQTQKQRMLMFPYVLSWCIAVTGDSAFIQYSAMELRVRVCQVLDLILTLLLTSTYGSQNAGSGGGGGGKRGARGRHALTDTFLCLPTSSGERLGFDLSGLCRVSDADNMQQLARGAASLFVLLLRSHRTLGIVKGWVDTLDRKLQAIIHTFVEDHVSSVLIHESLMEVLSKNPEGTGQTFEVSENYSVTVNTSQSTITLSYTQEDATVTVNIAFPPCFPLKPPVVGHETTRGTGVSEMRWRTWMLKMTAMMFSGSASVWDCIKLFESNIEGHFAGVEPCPICYAIVSAEHNRLPDMQCSVCRSAKFHVSCLHTWWNDVGKTQCPMCRSPWVTT